MEFINNTIDTIINNVIRVLPTSPFQPYIQQLKLSSFSENLQYLNWFIPIGDFVNILGGWLAVISIFYLYSVIMRWVKLIGD